MMPELKNEHIWSGFQSYFISCSAAFCVRQTSTDKVCEGTAVDAMLNMLNTISWHLQPKHERAQGGVYLLSDQ